MNVDRELTHDERAEACDVGALRDSCAIFTTLQFQTKCMSLGQSTEVYAFDMSVVCGTVRHRLRLVAQGR